MAAAASSRHHLQANDVRWKRNRRHVSEVC